MNYALIGKKLGHSFSADYFNTKFRREGISSEYFLVELADFGELSPFLASHTDFVGLNVTIPYKEDACRLCDRLTPEALEIGAVNTIFVSRDNGEVRLYGTNTDAPGFAKAVADGARGKKRALVLGTGGASKAVCYALRKMGIDVTKVSRAPRPDCITYGDITPDVMVSHRLIVNTTPLGMYPNVDSAPDIPYDLLTPDHFCFDAVYNPETTQFMRLASEHGAGVKNGLEMLHNQAILAWQFWNAQL